MVVVGALLAAAAGFVLGGAYYAVVPATPAMPGHEPPARPAVALGAVELARSAAVAGLVAGLMVAAGFSGPGAGVALGAALWILPLVLLGGSVFHEGTAGRAAIAHAGDWLLKLLAMGAVVGLFT